MSAPPITPARADRRLANLTFLVLGGALLLGGIWIVAAIARVHPVAHRPLDVAIDPILGYRGGAPAHQVERPTAGTIIVRQRTSPVAGYFRETEFVVTAAEKGLPRVEVRAVS